MKIRFHLDESVHLAVARALRRRMIDVSTPKEADLLGQPDISHLAFAYRERRVIITHDSDFLVLAQRGVPHSGIVFSHNQARSIGEICRFVELLWLTREVEGMIGRIEFI